VTSQTLLIDGAELEITIDRDGSIFTVRATGASQAIEVAKVGENEVELVVDGVNVSIPFIRTGGEVQFALGGAVHTTQTVEKGPRRRQKEHSMAAPMPGVVLKIFVSAGDEVAKGAPLIILEAMKMEHQIVSPYDGVVRSIACQVGQLVQPGVELIVVDPRGEAAK
jgi:biotin carboxyl carrier protein